MIVNNSALWKKALAPDKKVAPPTVTPVTQPVQPTQPTSEPKIIEIVKIDTEKVDRLQKELDAVKLQLKDCDEEKKTCEDQKAILSKKIGELEEKINSTPDDIPPPDGDDLLVQINGYKETIETLMKEKESDKVELASLESLKDRLEVAEKALKIRTNQLIESNHQIDELKQQVSDLTGRITSINVKNLDDSEIKDLRSKISVQEIEISKLSESGRIDGVTISGLRSQVTNSKKLLDEKTAEMEAELKEKDVIIDKLTEDAALLRERIVSLNMENIDDSEIKDLRSKLDESNDNMSKLTESGKVDGITISGMRTELAALKKLLDTKDVEMRELKLETDRIEKEMKDLTQEVLDLTNQLADNDDDTTIEDLESIVRGLELKISGLESSIREQDNKTSTTDSTHEAALGVLNGKLSTLQQTIDERDDTISRLEKEIQDTSDSVTKASLNEAEITELRGKILSYIREIKKLNTTDGAKNVKISNLERLLRQSATTLVEKDAEIAQIMKKLTSIKRELSDMKEDLTEKDTKIGASLKIIRSTNEKRLSETSALTNKLREKQEELDTLSEKISEETEMGKTIKELNETIKDLEEELVTANNDITGKDLIIEELSRGKETLETSIKKMEILLRDTMAARDDLSNTSGSNVSGISSVFSERSELRQPVDLSGLDDVEIEREVDEIASTRETLILELERIYNTFIESIANEIENIRENSGGLSPSEVDEIISQMEEDIVSLESKRDAQLDPIVHMSSHLKDMYSNIYKSTVDSKQVILDKIIDMEKDFKEQMDKEVENLTKTFNLEASSLKDQLRKSKDANDRMSSRIFDTLRRLSVMVKKNKELGEQVDDLRSQLRGANNLKKGMDTRISDLIRDKKSLETTISDLEGDKNDLATGLADTTSRRNQLMQELKDTLAEKKDLENSIQQTQGEKDEEIERLNAAIIGLGKDADKAEETLRQVQGEKDEEIERLTVSIQLTETKASIVTGENIELGTRIDSFKEKMSRIEEELRKSKASNERMAARIFKLNIDVNTLRASNETLRGVEQEKISLGQENARLVAQIQQLGLAHKGEIADLTGTITDLNTWKDFAERLVRNINDIFDSNMETTDEIEQIVRDTVKFNKRAETFKKSVEKNIGISEDSSYDEILSKITESIDELNQFKKEIEDGIGQIFETYGLTIDDEDAESIDKIKGIVSAFSEKLEAEISKSQNLETTNKNLETLQAKLDDQERSAGERESAIDGKLSKLSDVRDLLRQYTNPGENVGEDEMIAKLKTIGDVYTGVVKILGKEDPIGALNTLISDRNSARDLLIESLDVGTIVSSDKTLTDIVNTLRTMTIDHLKGKDAEIDTHQSIIYERDGEIGELTGTIQDRDNTIEKNTEEMKKLTEAINKVNTLLEERPGITEDRLREIDEEIRLIEQEIDDITPTIPTIHQGDDVNIADTVIPIVQKSEAVVALEIRVAALRKEKEPGVFMNFSLDAYSKMMDMMTNVSPEGTGVSFLSKMELLYTKIVSHFEQDGGHILNGIPGSTEKVKNLLLWTYTYYMDSLENWKALKTSLDQKITENMKEIQFTPIFVRSRGIIDSHMMRIPDISANINTSEVVLSQLAGMITERMGMIDLATVPELVKQLEDAGEVPHPGLNLKWKKRYLSKRVVSGAIDRDTESSTQRNKRGRDGVESEPVDENTDKRIKSTGVRRQVAESETPPMSMETSIEYFVENLRRPIGKTGEGVPFSLQQHTGLHTNSLLQLKSMLVSQTAAAGSKEFTTMRSERLFTGDRLNNKVNVVKTKASVERTRYRVNNIVQVREFVAGNRIDMVTSINLENSSIRKEYDSVINRLVVHLGDRVVTRGNDDLVTLNMLLDNGGRERLVYLLINLFGISVKEMDTTRLRFKTVQVVAPSIDIPTDSSILSDMASMFMWF